MKINIYEARMRKGLSDKQLADLCGLSKSTINNYENWRTSPSMDNIEKIARALGVRISDIYESDIK